MCVPLPVSGFAHPTARHWFHGFAMRIMVTEANGRQVIGGFVAQLVVRFVEKFGANMG